MSTLVPFKEKFLVLFSQTKVFYLPRVIITSFVYLTAIKIADRLKVLTNIASFVLTEVLNTVFVFCNAASDFFIS